MKAIVQNFKTGELSVSDVPEPKVRPEGILVRTHASLISPGTDRAVIAMAKKGYLGKAADRPDLLRKVVNMAKNEGLWSTYKVVKNLIAEPVPLGYSLVGHVVAVGRGVNEVSVGDRVACAGLGHANHAEVVSIPRNLFVSVPDAVQDEQAAYVTLGAIAMHGIRQADQQFGAIVLVVGLGLLGQVTAQLCRAAGLRVIGLDLDRRKLELARTQGVEFASTPDDPGLAAGIAQMTNGHGVDAALLTAASRDSGAIFEQVAGMCRDRARVVVVGDIKMDISRRTYFQKELEILQSRSYGPGRYDANYEDKGQDYPIGYVRWTERRNMAAFLAMIADGRIDMRPLTTHRYPIENADEAYDLVTGEKRDYAIGIVLTYAENALAVQPEPSAPAVRAKKIAAGAIGLGIIGTGQFAKGILLPAIFGSKEFRAVGVSSARGLSAKTIAGRYHAQYATSDAMRVLEDPGVQAVVIATRHDNHARYVIEALRRGLHVFVEKPLCISEEELAEIEKEAACSQGTLMVGFNRRFSPLLAAMADHFRERKEPMALAYRVNAGRIPLNNDLAWVHDPSSGGGRIIGEVCHFVDVMQALTGSRPSMVSAMAVNPRRANLAADDIVTLNIGFEDGSLGTIHYWSNGDRSFAKERLEVFCQERIAVLDNYRRLELVAVNRNSTRKSYGQLKGFAEEARAFAQACLTGIPAIPLESLCDTTRATLAAVQQLSGAAAKATNLHGAG